MTIEEYIIIISKRIQILESSEWLSDYREANNNALIEYNTLLKWLKEYKMLKENMEDDLK